MTADTPPIPDAAVEAYLLGAALPDGGRPDMTAHEYVQYVQRTYSTGDLIRAGLAAALPHLIGQRELPAGRTNAAATPTDLVAHAHAAAQSAFETWERTSNRDAYVRSHMAALAVQVALDVAAAAPSGETTAPPPSYWRIPPDPGPSVTRVRDDEGNRWVRHPRAAADEHQWMPEGGDPEDPADDVWWTNLVDLCGPLYDATPAGADAQATPTPEQEREWLDTVEAETAKYAQATPTQDEAYNAAWRAAGRKVRAELDAQATPAQRDDHPEYAARLCPICRLRTLIRRNGQLVCLGMCWRGPTPPAGDDQAEADRG